MINVEQNRKIGIVTISLVLVIVTGFVVFGVYNSSVFRWGLLVGIVFGIGMCIYLAGAWDPINLQPTNPNTSRASLDLLWVIPLGIIAAKVLSNFLSDIIEGLLLGCLFSWLEITLIYFVFQLWWHRPK